jgi:hypothetical protein
MTYVDLRPAWLRDSDETPHRPETSVLWSENYYSCAYDPSAQIGVYFHLSSRSGTPGVWEEVFAVFLPEDQFLVSKAFAPGRDEDGPVVAGTALRCDEPFDRWTKTYRGAARLVTGDELRSGPLGDGIHTPVDLSLTYTAMSPPFDYGRERIEQSWADGHYEQQHTVTGELRYDGNLITLEGTGLRDHSWGPRDLSPLGSTVWLHGQFPDSGRSFMLVHVPQPPGDPMTHAVVCNGKRVHKATVRSEVPVASDVEEAERGGYALTLETEDGTSTIEAEMLQAVRMSFVGPSEFCFGYHRGPGAHHDYVEAVTRFTWDGEIGYGFSERTVRV